MTNLFRAENVTHLGHFRVAAHEAGQLGWKLLSSRGFALPKRGKLIAEVAMAQLHHPFGTGKIPQHMGAEVAQPHVVGQCVGNQIAGGARQQGLAAMRELAKARRPVDRRADVVVLVT